MAMSNWDILSFGPEGMPGDGTLNGFIEGTSVNIYKSSLHVSDENMWSTHGGYVKPIIASIQSGSMTISDFTIKAIRHEAQGSIFFYVESHSYEKDKDSEHRFMAGIGCYGYEDTMAKLIKHFNIDEDVYEVLGEGEIHGNLEHPGGQFGLICNKIGDESADMVEFMMPNTPENAHFHSKYVGVTQETFNAFMAWLDEEAKEHIYDPAFKEWYAKVKASTPKRFNQGDNFIANELGEVASATGVGESETPIFMKMLEGAKQE